MGQKPAETAVQGVRLHNPDYVKFAPSKECEGFPFDLPGEAAAGEGLAAVAGPSPALCQPRTEQRNRGPNFPNSSTTAQFRISVVNMQPPSPASAIVRCEVPAALIASLGVGPAPKVVCRNMSATPPSSPFLLGKPSA